MLLLEDAAPVGERCWMVNVSMGGLAVHAPEDSGIDVDAHVVVEVPLGRSVSRIKTTCVVVGISGDNPRIAHLRFVDESELFMQTIEAAVAEWQRRTGEYPIQDGDQPSLPGVWREGESKP